MSPAQVQVDGASGLWDATVSHGRRAVQPGPPGLGRLSYLSARGNAYCDPVDRDDWLAHAAALAQRFGFEE